MNRELLRELIHYDPNTGDMTWLPRAKKFFKSNRDWKIWNTRYSNIKINNICKCNGKSYKRIRIFGKDYLQHRVAFVYLYDELPVEIDHVNGDGTDNREINLRGVSRRENCKNARLAKDNTSGVNGITWDNWSGKWLVRIGVNGKGVNLGRFLDFFEAVCTRKSAELKYEYHPNHGDDRPY